jgi:chemotaxis protein methyltransferase CheR
MAQACSADYRFLRDIVFNRSQNTLDPSRDYLFDAKLTRILRNHGMNRIGELVHHLQSESNPDLERNIAEAMTINETSFFRDCRPFDVLRDKLLPKLIEARRHTRGLRMWSAACSSGQEALSLAMLLRDSFPLLLGWDVRIEATDISAEMVERAKLGRFHRFEINRGLPARFIVRYFDRVGEDWVVKPEVQAMCNFRQANLCGTHFPFSRATDRFDVIFLRNVMLYFSPETRKVLLERIHRVLEPDGYLFLGASEQPADAQLWRAVIADGACYFVKAGTDDSGISNTQGKASESARLSLPAAVAPRRATGQR